MPRHSGRSGKVFAQVGGGTKFSNIELTDSGDHITYGVVAAQTPWGDNPAPVVKPDGVLPGLEVIPDNAAANDVVDIKAGTAFVAGVKTTITAGTVTTLLRPATPGNVRINSITRTQAGAFALVSGTEGAPGGARGAAGGPPFIPTTSFLLADVSLFGTAAAAITAAEIDNTSQERGDIPGFEPDHFAGTVKGSIALEAIHTGTVTRKVYADFKLIQLAEVGDIKEWNIDVKKDSAETQAAGDEYKRSVPTHRSWSGSMSTYHESPYWFKQADRDAYALLKFRTSSADPYEFVGIANVEWGVKAPSSDAVMEDITFTGNGPLTLSPV